MEEKLAKFLDELDHLQLRSALKMAMNISAAANKFLTKVGHKCATVVPHSHPPTHSKRRGT